MIIDDLLYRRIKGHAIKPEFITIEKENHKPCSKKINQEKDRCRNHSDQYFNNDETLHILATKRYSNEKKPTYSGILYNIPQLR
jgi:hypothetical protein